ncbi:MAG: leucine-rich repeat domain-containing protein [Clostridiales bacterium]|nr:leucine-rich repeat domain-containing protein [Clostridiales bacterium]
MRRISSLLLMIIVIASPIIPAVSESVGMAVLGSNDCEYIVNADGYAVITMYYGLEEYLTIPTELDGYSIVGIGDNAFSGCSSLISISLPDSIQSIGDSAFAYCSFLTSVQLPNNLQSIGDTAFSYDPLLTAVQLPNSLLSIGHLAFAGCSSLTSFYLPNSIQSIGDWAFADYDALILIVEPDSYAYEYAVLFWLPYQYADSFD